MTELGQTSDPTALIPGNPQEIERRAQLLRREGEKFQESGETLKRVSMPGWTGAAADAFHASFHPEPSKWESVGKSALTVSRALLDLADAVRAAQRQASEAIELWKRGEQTGAGADTSAADATASGAPPPASAENEYQQRAHEVLNQARTTLHSAGDHAAGVINGSSTQKRTDNAVNNLVNSMTAPMSASGKGEAKGPNVGAQAKGPGNGKLGELKAYAHLFGVSAQGKVGNTFANAAGKAQASAGTEAAAFGGIYREQNRDGTWESPELRGRAEADAGVKASAQGKTNLGALGARGSAEGFAGAQAGVEANASYDHLNAKAGAFAGAKGKVTGGGDIGGIGVSGTAEGWAGAGAEAGITYGMQDDGHWKLGMNVGASPYVGGKLGFQVDIDPDKVAQTAEGVADTAGDAAHAVGDAADSTVDTVKSWF